MPYIFDVYNLKDIGTVYFTLTVPLSVVAGNQRGIWPTTRKAS